MNIFNLQAIFVFFNRRIFVIKLDTAFATKIN